jgi:hypothetical protein
MFFPDKDPIAELAVVAVLIESIVELVVDHGD